MLLFLLHWTGGGLIWFIKYIFAGNETTMYNSLYTQRCDYGGSPKIYSGLPIKKQNNKHMKV